MEGRDGGLPVTASPCRRAPLPPSASFGLVLVLTVALQLLSSTASAVEAQERPYTSEEERWLDAGWGEDAAFAAANAVMTGVVTGLLRKLARGGSFGDGFRAGAAAGVVTYAGKRIAARRFGGAGLLGRQVASVGASMASNARENRAPLDRVIVQLGVARLYWDRAAGRVTIRPDVLTMYFATLAVIDTRADLDWSRTLSAGAPVFVTSGQGSLDGDAAGRAYGGMVILDRRASLPLDDIAAHERVHILQHDQHFALWGEPLERGFARLVGGRASAWLARVDLGLALLPVAPMLDFLPRAYNPAEVEADFLTVR